MVHIEENEMVSTFCGRPVFRIVRLGPGMLATVRTATVRWGESGATCPDCLEIQRVFS